MPTAVEQIIIGRYEDRVSKEIERGTSNAEKGFRKMATAAKAFVGIVLAREVKKAFKDLVDFAREHNTEATKTAEELSRWIDRLKAVVVNSEGFKSILKFISDGIQNIVVLISNWSEVWKTFFDFIGLKARIWVEEFREGLFGLLEEFHPVLRIAGMIRDALIPPQNLGELYGDQLTALVKFQEAVERGKKSALEIDISKTVPKETPKEAITTMDVVAVRDAQRLSTMLIDIKTEQLESELDLERRFLHAVADLEEEQLKEQKEREEEQFQMRMAKAQATAAIFANLAATAEAFGKKGFAAMKAASIAEAIVNTYAAANVALKSAPPPFNFALAASVVAAGLANVAKIASTNYGSRSGGSAAGGGGSARNFGSQQPSSDVGPTTQINLRIDTMVGTLDEMAARGIQEQLQRIEVKNKSLDRFTGG